MQFTDEVDWDVGDFAIFGAMLVVAGGIYELAARMTENNAALRSRQHSSSSG
jgi:hypothetical protein